MIELIPSRSRSSWELRDEPVDRADEHVGRREVVVDVDLDPVRARILSSRSAANLRGWSVTSGAVPVG